MGKGVVSHPWEEGCELEGRPSPRRMFRYIQQMPLLSLLALSSPCLFWALLQNSLSLSQDGSQDEGTCLSRPQRCLNTYLPAVDSPVGKILKGSMFPGSDLESVTAQRRQVPGAPSLLLPYGLSCLILCLALDGWCHHSPRAERCLPHLCSLLMTPHF